MKTLQSFPLNGYFSSKVRPYTENTDILWNTEVLQKEVDLISINFQTQKKEKTGEGND